jgi:hypothetical protein
MNWRRRMQSFPEFAVAGRGPSLALNTETIPRFDVMDGDAERRCRSRSFVAVLVAALGPA